MSNKITKLSNCFIDWLSLLSLSFASSPFLLSFCSPCLHSVSLFAPVFFHPSPTPTPTFSSAVHFPLSSLSSLLCALSPFAVFHLRPLTQQADRPVHQRSLIAEGLPANVFRCHGDAMERGTVRTGQTRSSALQVSLWLVGGNVGWRGERG